MNAEILAFDPPAGIAETLRPGLRRILAPNPSPMTFRGTNTYLLGTRAIAVIDPGPADPAHLKAILDALEPGQDITHIFVTHSHVDHSPLAPELARATGAPVLAFGDSLTGRSPVMIELAEKGLAVSGEGVDQNFAPDLRLADGDVVSQEDWSLEALHTPGHFGNHLSFAWGNLCFVGDHIMGWASSLVSPPEGDLTDFMASCRTLQGRKWQMFHSGHGAPITAPAERLEWLIAHRNGRESEILRALEDGPAKARVLAERIYTETPAALLPAATRNVFAHLVDLTGKSLVAPEIELHSGALFQRK